MSTKRGLIAGTLSLVYPGLGHLYLRAWFRALAWFGLALATAVLVVPESSLETARSGNLDAVFRATRSLPTTAVVALLVVRALNVIDATLIGLRVEPRREEDAWGATCPNCGRDLDEDIDFCQWCATSVERPA